MDYDNVREALKALLGLNDKDNLKVTKTYSRPEDEAKTPWRPMTIDDLAQDNYELAANIADLLGMSDLYLGDEQGN